MSEKPTAAASRPLRSPVPMRPPELRVDARPVKVVRESGPVQVPKKLLLKASPCYFASTILSGPPEPPYNGRFRVSSLHLSWEALLLAYLRLVVLSARDHGKTFFFDYAYPIWKSTTVDRNKGRIISGSEKQAIRILGDIKREFETNPKLESYLPAINKGNWSETHIRLRNGSTIQASGWGSRIRGDHPNWLVSDDGLNDETAYSETVRRRQIEYFYNALSNMVSPQGQLLLVGTPFHELDLYADLSRNSEYMLARFPAVNKDGTALCPDRYTLQRLEAKKREIGSVRFSREFLCVPVSDDMSLFPMCLFQGDPREQYQVKLGMPCDWWVERGIVSFYLGVDFALSSSASADYTVIWVVGLDVNGNRWIIDIFADKGLPYQTQKSRIVEYSRKYRVALATLESNQAQRIFGKELQRLTDLPIFCYTTGSEKHSLERGVPAMRLLLENEKYRIPRGDLQSVEATNIWISQMRSFVFDKGKVVSVAPHDDYAMASWLCEQGISQGRAFGFSMGPEEGDEEAAAAEAALDAQEAEIERLELERERAEKAKSAPRKAVPVKGRPTQAKEPPLVAPVPQKTVSLLDDDLGGLSDGHVWSLNRGF